MPWMAAGLSLAGGAFGSSTARRKASQAKKNFFNAQMQAWGMLKAGKHAGGKFWDQAEAYLSERIGRGDEAIRTIGQQGKQDILRREQQSLGGISADMANRGLGNTTLSGNLQRGSRLDTDTALGRLSENIAGLQAQYYSSTGQQMASLLTGRAGFEYNYQTDAANVALAAQAPPQFGQAQAWGQMGGDIAGLFSDYWNKKQASQGGSSNPNSDNGKGA